MLGIMEAKVSIAPYKLVRLRHSILHEPNIFAYSHEQLYLEEQSKYYDVITVLVP